MKKKSQRIAALLSAVITLATAFPVYAFASDELYYQPAGSQKQYLLQTGSVGVEVGFSNVSSVTTNYYYSDGYFEGDPTVYDSHLATMSLLLSESALRYSSEECEALFSELGYSAITPNSYFQNGSFKNDSIGFAVAKKAMRYASGEQTGKTIIAVAIRGSYQDEWIANFTMGSEGESTGFKTARDQVLEGIRSFISNQNLSGDIADGNVIFWIVGYSRAAATANLTAKSLIDTYVAGQQNKLFCYSGGTCMGGQESEKIAANAALYGAIHNIVNDYDPVTWVAPYANYGFCRYGVDHNITETADMRNTGSQWYEQWYHLVPSGSVYPSSFHVAYVDLDLPNPDDYWTTLGLATALGKVVWDIYQDTKETELTLSYFVKAYPDSQQINLPTYLKDLTTNLTGWMGSRTTHATKKFTASSGDFPGSENVTREEAMALYLGTLMYMSGNQQQRLFNCFRGMEEQLNIDTSSLSGVIETIATLLPHYKRAMNWLNTKNSEKAKTISYLWSLVENCTNEYGETVEDVLGQELFGQMKKAFPIAADFALTIANEDYYQHYSSRSVSTSHHMYMIASVIYNAVNDDLSLVSAHYPEEYITALQMEDDFYEAYRIAVDGILQPIQEGDIQTVWFASYDENGQMVTVQGAQVATLPYDTIARMDSGSGTNWNLFYTDASAAPAVSAAGGTVKKAG